VVWGSDKNLYTAKVFTFLWLPHCEEWLTMHKSQVTERTPCLKDASVFSTSWYSS
jgi:hypothetical protein